MADDAPTKISSKAGCAVALTVTATLFVLFSGGMGLVALIAWTYNALPLGEDSWSHYAGGGMFVTAAPDLSADGSSVVLASPETGHGDVYLYDLGRRQAKRLITSAECELSPWFRPRHDQILFERENGQRRHLWLHDLTSGADRRLTQGDVLDDIADVSPDGKQALVQRSPLAYGLGRHASPYLLDIDSGALVALPDNFFGQFRGTEETLIGGRYRDGNYSIEELALDGTLVANHGNGFNFQAVDRQGVRIVVSAASKEFKIDADLAVWDLESSERESIGYGHSPCIFDNGKVLFFSGYERQAWIWEKGRPGRKIDSPETVIDVPRRTVGNQAAVFVMRQSGDQEPYMFDAETERFAPLIGQTTEPATR